MGIRVGDQYFDYLRKSSSDPDLLELLSDPDRRKRIREGLEYLFSLGGPRSDGFKEISLGDVAIIFRMHNYPEIIKIIKIDETDVDNGSHSGQRKTIGPASFYGAYVGGTVNDERDL